MTNEAFPNHRFDGAKEVPSITTNSSASNEAKDQVPEWAIEMAREINLVLPYAHVQETIARALLAAERRGEEKKEAEIKALLLDPAAVRVNYLRGGIACQTLIDEAERRGEGKSREAVAGRVVLAPEDPTADMCADAVRFALSVNISSEYPWMQYMHDLYKVMLASAPPAIRQLGEEPAHHHNGEG